MGCLFVSGFCFGVLITLQYWARRFRWLTAQLEAFQKQSNADIAALGIYLRDKQ